MRTCSACPEPHFALNLCRQHYDQSRRDKRRAKNRERYATDPDFRQHDLDKHVMLRARKRSAERGISLELLLKREGRDPVTGRKRQGRYAPGGTLPAPPPPPPDRVERTPARDPQELALKRRMLHL